MLIRSSIKPLVLASLLGTSVLGLVGCEQNTAQSQQQGAGGSVSVKVATMKAEDIFATNNLPGRVISYRVAEVRPQVSGIVLKRLFKEGADVKEGDVLYQIEPSTYQAALNNAKAELAKAQADESVARKTKNRYSTLVSRRVISQQDFDTAEGEWRQAVASVKVAQAMVESAQIDLDYTKIRAPISGRIGISDITEGALVTSGQADYLTTIQQLDPIYVDMMQDTSDMAAQDIKDQAVNIQFKNGQVYSHPGKVSFSDISVDTTTGSQTIRAVIPNPEQQLLPGMYVKGNFKDKNAQQVLLVPQSAVQVNSQGKSYVYTLDEENKIKETNIDFGDEYQQYWIVRSGLKEGDRVVNSNLLKVRPSMQVTPIEESSKQADSSAQQAQQKDNKE